jgi:lipoprotein NlpD
VKSGRGWNRLVAVAFAMLAAVVVGACSTGGIHHVVGPGENLFRIGKAYDRPWQEIARENDIPAPYTIRVGQRVWIRGARRQLPVELLTPSAVAPARSVSRPAAKTQPRTARATPKAAAPAPARPGLFGWPVAGRVLDGFGPRERGHHDGIDIAADEGSDVRVARAGRVIFSDRLSGYGNVVIVEHDRDLTSVYAHNSENLVATGVSVKAGQRIARVGQTGRAARPHLHFEIRARNVARDPLEYLPPRP